MSNVAPPLSGDPIRTNGGRDFDCRGAAAPLSVATMTVSSRAAYHGVSAVLAMTAVAFVLWRAWACDDAFITFRHVANL